MTVEDKEIAENAIEGCLEGLRSCEEYPISHRNRWRKVIKNELTFLQDEHPDSHVLKLDMSDVSLEIE